MSNDASPLINIYVPKTDSSSSQRYQQKPNRNRAIPVVSSAPTSAPAKIFFEERARLRHPQDLRTDDGPRPLPENIPGKFLLEPSNKITSQDPLKKDVKQSPAIRKKVKPKLNIPAKPEEISSNWEKLKSTLPLPTSKRFKARKARKPTNEVERNGSLVPAESATAQETHMEIPEATKDTFVKVKSFSGLTKAVAMDCEFVGVGPSGQENMLARVSIVNLFGHCVYDTFVKPTELVRDYRTAVSGVRPQDLKNKGKEFSVVQQEVANILNGRILVGHAVHNDLAVLLLSHPKIHIRDTSRYKAFRKICGGGLPSLKKLTAKVLGVAVQTGEHDSIQDAQATMRLYTKYKKQWESELSLKYKKARLNQASS